MFVARDVSPVRRALYALVDPFFYLPMRGVVSPRAAALPVAPGPPNRPTISIVTPSFNQAEFLERTIRSVLSQGYPALEYIVQDGGSTDGSVAMIEAHAHELAFWESGPDGGQSAGINAGFRRATGEILMFLNSDDVLMPGALAYIGDHFAAHPEVDIVYSHSLMIDGDDRPIALQCLPAHSGRALRYYNYIPQHTCAWRRRAWDAIGGALDESFHYAMDWDLFARFVDAGVRFERLPTVLAAFRRHADQKTQAARPRVVAESALIQRRFAGRDPSLLEVVTGAAPHVLARMGLGAAYRLGLTHVDLPPSASSHGRAAQS